MGQNSSQNGCNKQILKADILGKYIKNVDEETLNEISMQLYEFTKLILEKQKNENQKRST